jgi:predicted flap endonuclease-1-like 5' DNA nuclease
MAKIIQIEGIGQSYALRLQELGILTTQALLEQGATPAGRQDIAGRTGISQKLILEWVNHADLCRIKGIGEEYADLLEAAGVDTVPELAQRNPDSLYEKLLALNQEKRLVRRLPPLSAVSSWIEQAKTLPRVIKYAE